MGQLKFISRDKLVEYLDEELRQFFNEVGLYEITQYGWLGDGEQDPEYLGHALWQEAPPESIKLLGLGDEFTDLMRSARHSIGLACLYHDSTDSLINDNGYTFSFHLADSTNKLQLASDRIREFFITAFVQRFPDSKWPPIGKIIHEGKSEDSFRSPFKEIHNEVAAWNAVDLPLQECLTSLLPLAEVVAHNRSANQDPFRHLKLFQNRVAAAVTNLAMGYPDEGLFDDLSCDDDSSNMELIEWYNALVKVSNYVFLSENFLRDLSSKDVVPGRTRKHKTI